MVYSYSIEMICHHQRRSHSPLGWPGLRGACGPRLAQPISRVRVQGYTLGHWLIGFRLMFPKVLFIARAAPSSSSRTRGGSTHHCAAVNYSSSSTFPSHRSLQRLCPHKYIPKERISQHQSRGALPWQDLRGTFQDRSGAFQRLCEGLTSSQKKGSI